MKLILASQSPRRRELMAMAAADFSVLVSQADEMLPPDTPPGAAVEELALRKALAVQRSLAGEERRSAVIVGSDTVVAIDGEVQERPRSQGSSVAAGSDTVLAWGGGVQEGSWSQGSSVAAGSDTVLAWGGKVLGKPHSREECLAMLAALSGREHTVHTGVALVQGDRRRVFRETAQVEFWPLSREVIDWYSGTDEPYDKAGGYGVQGLGALLVKGVRGDYYTVMGLPVSRLWRELRGFCADGLPLIGPTAENLRN